jgi:hypothetical protein
MHIRNCARSIRIPKIKYEYSIASQHAPRLVEYFSHAANVADATLVARRPSEAVRRLFYAKLLVNASRATLGAN